jgi:ABC-type uncharacterized transport system substrate-binding protein
MVAEFTQTLAERPDEIGFQGGGRIAHKADARNFSRLLRTRREVAFFLNPLNAFHTVSVRQAFAAAHALGIKLQALEVRATADLDDAFAAIVREKPDALFILADRVFLHNRKRMMDFATQHRLPSVNAYREVVEAGGLMSYGPSYEDMHRRAADYVDKILRGTNPGALPVEQPIKFTLIINLKAAKALGLTVPPTLLARADEVIE